MSINSRLISALSSLVAASPNRYSGSGYEYAVFDTIDTPELFGDSSPGVISSHVILNYYAPVEMNTVAKRKQIAEAIHAAGFTYPTSTSSGDASQQRIIYEFEGIDNG